MAPLYDVASLAPHHRYAPKAKLAQKIGGTYIAGGIGERNWVRFASEAGLDPAATLHRVQELAAQVPDAIRDAAKGLDLTRAEQETADLLAEKITLWTEQCRTSIGTTSTPPDPAQPKPRVPQARAPKGTALGGRFLPIQHSESDVRLDDEDAREPVEEDPGVPGRRKQPGAGR